MPLLLLIGTGCESLTKVGSILTMRPPDQRPWVAGRWRGTAERIELYAQTPPDIVGRTFPGVVLANRSPVGPLRKRRVEPYSGLVTSEGWPPLLAHGDVVLQLPQVQDGSQIEVEGEMRGGETVVLRSPEHGVVTLSREPLNPELGPGLDIPLSAQRIWLLRGDERVLVFDARKEVPVQGNTD